MKCHLIHGIHTSPNSRRLLSMRDDIEAGSGIETVYHEYGDIWAINTWWKNPRIAKRLLPEVKEGDVLVGHSNGCAIGMRMLRLGAPAVGLVCLNGALDSNITLPPQLKFMHVYYNSGDGVVGLTRTPVVRLSFDALWGTIGCSGYLGKDERVWQLDCGKADDGMPDLAGHSSIIDPPHASAWGRFVGLQIKGALR